MSATGGEPPAPLAPPAAGAAATAGRVVVIGAGPAGLTAAYSLGKSGAVCTVVEADDVVGGIARTVERDGWRFDIGGHRFFTKVPEVEELWHEILGPDDLLVRERLSRIYFEGKFFDYPIRIRNALKGLGTIESIRCGASYLWVRVRRPQDLQSFEGWTAARFGWRLYRKFFKAYTEKIWGIAATDIQADWAAQRIKNLSLWNAVGNAVAPRRNQQKITSLIDRFEYPRLGPGMMWQQAQRLVEEQGSVVRLATTVTRIRHSGGRAVAVGIEASGQLRPAGPTEELPVDHVISSMPLSELVLAMDPPAPDHVKLAAETLQYRDFLTVALVVPAERGFPDNWIYVHDPKVRLGRIQNFGSWSPGMVKDGRTCLGLEYFVFEGDEMWTMDDDDLVELGIAELCALGLASPDDVEAGYVVRMPKAYPVYDPGYADRVETIRRYLETSLPNVHPVGRNGMHRYNNQDHSMLTALLTVRNIFGDDFDTWTVNVEAEYHEEQVGRKGDNRPAAIGGGRSVPTRLPGRPLPVSLPDRPVAMRPDGPRVLAQLAEAAGLRRIGIVAWRDLDDPEAGGSELHAHEIARRWAGAGIEVVLRTSSVSRGPTTVSRDGYQVVRRAGRYAVFGAAPFDAVTGRLGRLDGLVEIWNGMPFLSPLWFRGPRVVFLHHVHAGMWQMVLSPGLARAGSGFESRIAPHLYRRSRIVTLSSSSREEIVAMLRMRPGRVTVVPPGVHERFSPVESRPRPDGSDGGRAPEPLVVAVGRLVPVKRFARLVAAAAALAPRHPGLQVVIVGEGYERPKLEAAIADAGLESVVKLPGRVGDDELVQLYRRAWVLAAPSLREGWGMTVTEAAACGTPAVASRIAGHLDAVEDDVSGLFFGSDDELVAVLDQILDDDALRTRLAKGALERVDQFSWDAAASGTLAALAAEARRR